jgi:hypothetical protein
MSYDSFLMFVWQQKGYNGSQLWDTAFALQAYHWTGLADEFKDTIIKGTVSSRSSAFLQYLSIRFFSIIC